MTTKNSKMSVTFEETTVEALDMREDLYLSKIAKQLDKDGAKTYSHDDAWK